MRYQAIASVEVMESVQMMGMPQSSVGSRFADSFHQVKDAVRTGLEFEEIEQSYAGHDMMELMLNESGENQP